MEKTSDLPIWVYLAFSSIKTRKGALLLLQASLVFSFYCIPWIFFFENSDWVSKIFLIEDWGWFAMMVPVTLWYWFSLRWVDQNSGWENPHAT